MSASSPPPDSGANQPASSPAAGAPQNPQLALHPLAAHVLALQRGTLPYAGPMIGPVLPSGIIPSTQMQHAQVQVWQGQFPPPEAVEKYEAILPGAFDRIIAMAERLQAAQIEETTRAQNYTRDDSRRGHWLGFSATALATIGAAVCTIVAAIMGATGAYFVGAALVSVPVMAVARALVESSKAPSATGLLSVAGNELAAADKPTAPPPAPPSP